jgi:hypothetical protein
VTVGPREFHLEEYKHLKQQIMSNQDRVSTIIKFVLGGIAAVYAWIITNKAGNSDGMWIPVLLSFYGALMVITIALRIHAMRKYLNMLENYLHNPTESLLADPVYVLQNQPVSGWEQFRARSSFHHLNLRAIWEVVAISLFALVFVLTLALATGCLKMPRGPSL